MFGRSVNEALIRTVNRLEDVQNLGIVNEMIFSDDSGIPHAAPRYHSQYGF